MKDAHAIPGTIDGRRYEDMRLLMVPTVIEYYKSKGEWNAITRVRFPVSERTDSIIVLVQRVTGLYREKWQRAGTYKAQWTLISTERTHVPKKESLL